MSVEVICCIVDVSSEKILSQYYVLSALESLVWYNMLSGQTTPASRSFSLFFSPLVSQYVCCQKLLIWFDKKIRAVTIDALINPLMR